MSAELEVLTRALVGKRVVGIEIDPTTASFIHHHSGRVTLTLEGGDTVLFRVGGFNFHHVEVVINGRKEIRT